MVARFVANDEVRVRVPLAAPIRGCNSTGRGQVFQTWCCGFKSRQPLHKGDSMKGYWKVPFRSVFCSSFGGMVKATIWCHIVLKLFPGARDMGTYPNPS